MKYSTDELINRKRALYISDHKRNPEVSISRIAEEMHATTRTVQRYISMAVPESGITDL